MTTAWPSTPGHSPTSVRTYAHTHARTRTQFAAFSPSNERASLASSVNLFVALAPVADVVDDAVMQQKAGAMRNVLQHYAEKHGRCTEQVEEEWRGVHAAAASDH